MTNEETTAMEITKTVTLQRTPEDTFRIFTEELGRWWPLRTHSVHEEQAVDAVVEGWPGGLVYEVTADGGRAVWGEVLDWDPPHRLRVSWHPGRAGGVATTWEVLFVPVEEDATRLELVHRGWEALGDGAAAGLESYTTGWDLVLSRLAGHTVGS